MGRTPAPGAGLRARLDRFLAMPGPRAVRRIADRYDRAGGPLLAGGLAYSALFAVVPAVLLVVGVAGAVIADTTTREGVARVVVAVLPPLAGLTSAVLVEATRDATALSVVGLLGLVWAASRFVVAFQVAMDRMLDGPARRSVLRQNGVALAAVVVLVAGLLAGTVIAGLSSVLDAAAATGSIPVVEGIVAVLLAVGPAVLTALAVGIVYRIVPSTATPWRALVPPALVVTMALTLLARLFVFIAPRLIGAAAILGTLVTVFVGLAWLSLSFQAILLGAAWMADRHATAGAGARTG